MNKLSPCTKNSFQSNSALSDLYNVDCENSEIALKVPFSRTHILAIGSLRFTRRS